MHLSYKYELTRDTNLKLGVYICQNEKNEKCAAEVCVRGIKEFPQTVDHGSILSETDLVLK